MAMDLNVKSQEFLRQIAALREGYGRTIVGHRDVLDYFLKALLSGGHILLEGLPGLGKTLMVRTLARLLSLDFSRVQFTPDLMPSDITGVNILVDGEGGEREFRFQRGPVFTNILLADEINRATPKTQSALLQVMEERQVTVFGQDYDLDDVFLTLATQNPIELKGTYPLPEAQLDRFMFKLTLPSPTLEELERIARRNIESMGGIPLPEPVLGKEAVAAMRRFIREIPVTPGMYGFASRFVLLTNPEAAGAPEVSRRFIRYGSSPRGLVALLAAAKVSAFLDGRFNLSWEDLEENYLACLRHRLILNFEAQVQKVRVDDILREIFGSLGRPSP
jgi:MoxR-like ATPase